MVTAYRLASSCCAVVQPAPISLVIRSSIPYRFEDTAVNLSEFRADQILLLGEEGEPERWGWHLELQIEPDARVVGGWLLKNAAFNRRLDLPVVLTVLYLTRGDRVTFPDTYAIEGGGLSNQYRFDTIHL